jgi:hypothetical protein
MINTATATNEYHNQSGAEIVVLKKDGLMAMAAITQPSTIGNK